FLFVSGKVSLLDAVSLSILLQHQVVLGIPTSHDELHLGKIHFDKERLHLVAAAFELNVLFFVANVFPQSSLLVPLGRQKCMLELLFLQSNPLHLLLLTLEKPSADLS